MSILRNSRHIVIPGDSTGVHIHTPRTAAATSWWVVPGATCVCAYAPKGAASYAASLSNLANPGTYDAAEGVAPSWATGTGWTFNGADTYLDTGWDPTTANRTMLVCFSGHTGAGSWSILCGQQSYIAGNNLSLGSVFANQAAYKGGSTVFVAPLLSAGVLAIAGNTGYRDGESECTLSDYGADQAYSVYIGAENYINSAIRYGNGNILALALYSDTLTSTEVATVSAAMAAL